MKLRKGDIVYSTKFNTLFTITGKRTEFDLGPVWGYITRNGVLTYVSANEDDFGGFETVQYIPNIGDVLVTDSGGILIVRTTYRWEDGKDTTLMAIGVNNYGDYSPTIIEFKDLHKYTILRNFKLG